jgi:SHS2 domain-containing protein
LTRGWSHTACPGGVRVAGHGTSLAEAFAEAALGVFALVVPPAAIEERERREVRAHAVSAEAFLEAWIGECLYLYDVEGFVARRVEFVAFHPDPGAGGEPLRLHCWLHGEEVDPARHGPGSPPASPLAHAISVATSPGRVEVSACLEVAT